MSDHLKTMRDHFDALKQQSADLARRNELMKDEVNTAVRERRECVADIADLTTQRVKLLQNLTDSKAEYADLCTQRGASDSELNEAKQTIADTRKAVGDIEASLKAQRDEKDALTAELETLRAAHAELLKKLQSVPAQAPVEPPVHAAPVPAPVSAPPAPAVARQPFLDTMENPFYDKMRGFYKIRYNAL